MASDFQQQQPEPSANDRKTNTDTQIFLTSDQIEAGTKVVMTHAQRQAYIKKSGLGKLFGVADLLPEVKDREVTSEATEESPRLKRVRGLFKRGLTDTNEQFSIEREVNDKDEVSERDS